MTEASGNTHRAPLFRYKGPRDGNGAIVLHKGMEHRKLRENAEEMVRNGRARKIIDEPPFLSVNIHPVQEAHNVALSEMMGE